MKAHKPVCVHVGIGRLALVKAALPFTSRHHKVSLAEVCFIKCYEKEARLFTRGAPIKTLLAVTHS